MSRIILTTGGTGGHIFPAIATAQAIRRMEPEAELLFIGSTYGPEGQIAIQAEIPFLALPSRGFLGRGLRALPAAAGMASAVLRACGALRKHKPDAVAVFGGYASFAPGIAAKFMGVPLLLHEQNAIAGTSNRILGRWANVICTSLPDTKGFGRECKITGNPVRADIAARPNRGAHNSKNLLVIGGSQGAHALNEFIVSILDELKSNNISILHQTGKNDYNFVKQAYLEAGFDASRVHPFIEDMKAAYEWADFAFCRAGASTIAELCVTGLGALLVPFPAAIHDHQTINAKIMINNGAAQLLPETELGQAREKLIAIMNDPDQQRKMGEAALKLAHPDAADAVATEILNLAHSSKGRR